MSEYGRPEKLDASAFGQYASDGIEEIEAFLDGHEAWLDAYVEELAENPAARVERYHMCRELLDREEPPMMGEASTETEAALHFLLWKSLPDERTELLQRYVDSPVSVQLEFELTRHAAEQAAVYSHLEQE